MSESSPKYQRRYQSGLGSAASMLGSGGLSNAGGPTKNAASAIAMIKRVEMITSRQARSGQNGLPLFFSSSSYSARYVAGSTGLPATGGSEIPRRKSTQRSRPKNGTMNSGRAKAE